MLLELSLKKIRSQEKKKLNKTNFYLYEGITSYIQNSNLRGIEKEEILQDIIDMILQAQTEKKPINLIIGNDYEEFCKSIIEEYTRSKSKIYRVINYIQAYLFWVCLILLAMVAFNLITSGFSFEIGLILDQIIVANLISLIIPALKKNRRKIISITPWHQRYSIMTKGIVAFGILLIFWRRFIYQLYSDPGVFRRDISFTIIIMYLAIMFIPIIGAEVYKRKYDNAN